MLNSTRSLYATATLMAISLTQVSAQTQAVMCLSCDDGHSPDPAVECGPNAEWSRLEKRAKLSAKGKSPHGPQKGRKRRL